MVDLPKVTPLNGSKQFLSFKVHLQFNVIEVRVRVS